MRQDLIGLVKVVPEEMSVDLREMRSSFVAMKKTQDLALDFYRKSAHFFFNF